VDKLAEEKAITREQALHDTLAGDAANAVAEHYEEEAGDTEQFSLTAYDV
jgi:hypothetical protein